MRLIQFYMPDEGRRVGWIKEADVIDLTSVNESWSHIHEIFFEARRSRRSISALLSEVKVEDAATLPYSRLLQNQPADAAGWILPPLDHPDPAHCFITGTGPTHLGSMEKRAEMHLTYDEDAKRSKTDSEKMFEMGLKDGKPALGVRGIQPEWFYKGTGVILRGHNDFLDIPAYAEDGGEEPEIVGCYIIDDDGLPCRVGFTIGNEWSDHSMERMNYLWLAHSKIRVCSIGPELITDQSFKDIRGRCRIIRNGEVLYDSGVLLTGEEHMSHSLANLEDHHFKYPQFRFPSDVHLHFFGTMKLSYPNRPPLETGDRIEIQFEGMGAELVNYVRRFNAPKTPTRAFKV